MIGLCAEHQSDQSSQFDSIQENSMTENLKGKRVLFAQRSAKRDGSAISGLISVRALLNAGCDVTVVFGHQGPMLDDYRKLGCQVEIFRHGDWLRPGGIARSFRRILKEWKLGHKLASHLPHNEFDLVYVNSLVSMSFAVYAKQRRIPCIWHVRELFSDVGGEMTIPSFGGKKIVRWLLTRYSTELVTNSISVEQNVLGDVSRRRTRVIYNAVDPDKINIGTGSRSLRETLGISDSATVIGVPSTLRPMKGQEQLIQALPRLLKTFPEAVVVLLGDCNSDYGNHLKNEVSSLGLRKSVFFAGSLNAMGEFYDICDAVCIPSIAEPFGRVAIEAFYSKRIVIVSDVGGLREIVQPGKTGLLFECGNIESLTSKLSWVMENPSASEEIVENAERDAHQRFAKEKYHSGIVAVSQNALESHAD